MIPQNLEHPLQFPIIKIGTTTLVCQSTGTVPDLHATMKRGVQESSPYHGGEVCMSLGPWELCCRGQWPLVVFPKANLSQVRVQTEIDSLTSIKQHLWSAGTSPRRGRLGHPPGVRPERRVRQQVPCDKVFAQRAWSGNAQKMPSMDPPPMEDHIWVHCPKGNLLLPRLCSG